MSHHTDEYVLCRAQNSICWERELTRENLLYSREIGRAFHCRQAAAGNLLASTCCFSVSETICSAQTMLYFVKGMMPFMVKEKIVVKLWHGFMELKTYKI